MSRSLGNFAFRYGIAAFSVALAILGRFLLDPALGKQFLFSPILLAVLVSVWFGGLRPALAAVVLGGIGAEFFLLEPHGSLTLSGLEEHFGLLLYGVTGLGVAILGGSMHSAQHALRAANAALEERIRDRTAALEATSDKLRHSETYFRSLIEGASSHAIYMLDLEGRVIRWNAVAEKVKGYCAEEIIGRHFSCFYTPEDVARDLPAQSLARAVAEGRFSGEGYRVRKDGTRFWANVTISPYYDDDGHTVGFVKVTQDMTDRRQTEVALREAEQRLQNALRWSHTGGWDLDLQTLTANRTLDHDQIFGYESLLPEWTYPDFLGHVLPEDRGEVDRLFQEAVAAQKDWSFECRIRRVDGEVRWIWASGGHVFDGEGRAQRLAGIVQDITERKASENALREERDLFAKIVSTVPVVICSFRRRPGGYWSFPFAGPEIRSIYGFEDQELVDDASGIYERIHPEDQARFLEGLRASGSTMTPWRAEYRVLHPQRGKIWVEAHAAPFREPDGTILWHGCLADITERKHAENALAERERMLQFVTSSIRAGLVVIGPEYQYLFANEAYTQIYGLTLTEVVGKSIPEVLPQAWSQIKPHLDEALSGIPGQFELVLPPLPGGHEDRTFFVMYEPRPREDGTRTSVVVVSDITARKRVETALIDRERLLGVVTGTIRVGLVVVGQDYRYQFANEAYAQIFALGSDDIVGRQVPEILPQAWPQIQPRLDRALAGERVAYELTLPAPGEGPLRYFSVNYEPRLDESGIRTVVVVVLDISESKRAEEKAARMNERIQLATRAARLGIWDLDLVENRLVWDDQMFGLYGVSREDFPGAYEAWLAGIHPDDREHCDRESQQARAGNGDYHSEFRLVWPDGRIRHLKALGEVFRDEAGKPVRMLGVNFDITERREAEAASQQQQLRLEGIVDSAMDGIITVGEDQRVILINAAAERMFGWLAKDVLGERVERFIPARFREGHEANVRSFGRTGIAPRTMGHLGQISGLRANGEEFPIEASISQIVVEGNTLYTVTCRDVTERVHAAETRKRLEAQLHQSQKMEAFGQLAGGVAHDFNNLLTIITGYSEWMLAGLSLEGDLRNMISEIHRAAERAAELTRQLLAFSRQQVIEPKVLDLNTVVDGVGRMLRRLIGEDVQLATVLSPSIGLVRVDPGQIEQVIMNLAVNARDAMPHGGCLTIETGKVQFDGTYAGTHPEAPKGDFVMLAISDTGIGMSQENRARIFEPFFTTKGIGKGTGLGLAVVHGIVKQSGGMIEVYSEIDKGTTFKIYLPIVHAASEEAEARMRHPLPRGTETILLVEDEVAVRMVTVLALQSLGYTVLEAQGGESAIQVMAEHSGEVALLLSDVVMPEMSGRTLAETLAAQYPDLKVLFVSGYTDDAIVRHGVLQAEVAFLQKPFTMGALARKVREVLDEQ